MNYWQLAMSLAWTVLAWVAFQLIKGVYNLYFHPLSRFPGPRAAASTSLWKAYIEVWKRESIVEKLFTYHAIYGDIVRIGPNELHFSKPSVYHQIYNPQNRWAKDPRLYHAFAQDVSSFTMVEYTEAKQRKDILLPLFSRKAIINMQDLVSDRIDDMCKALVEQVKAGEAVHIYDAYNCFAMDTITTFCFARSMDCLKEPGFKAPLLLSLRAAQALHPVVKHIPPFKLLSKFPDVLVTFFDPGMKAVIGWRNMIKMQVKEVLQHPETLRDAPHPIIYHELLKEDHGRKIPTESSLRDEAVLLVAAGTETVSNAAIVGTMHIIANRNIYTRLQTELREAWPNLEERPRYETLERLVYLSAIIKESLRLSHGVISPMTRVVPKGGASLSGEYVAGGTIVGISNCFVHMNDELFPKPQVFRPERWLEQGSEALDTYLVAFSKGPRSCLGINLGYCELYLLLATIFRRFHFQLNDVGPMDMRWKECYLPHYVGRPLTVKAHISCD